MKTLTLICYIAFNSIKSCDYDSVETCLNLTTGGHCQELKLEFDYESGMKEYLKGKIKQRLENGYSG